MKKVFLVLTVILGLSLIISSASFAQTLSVSTTIGSPSAVVPVITQVVPNINASGIDIGWLSSTQLAPGDYNLGFGTLSLLTGTIPGSTPPKTFSVFLPQYYYAIDFGYQYGGAAISAITVSTGGFSVPSGQPAARGLNSKAAIAFVKETYDPATGTSTVPEAAPFAHLTFGALTGGRSVGLNSDVAGGWLRTYVGIITNPGAANAPTGCSATASPDTCGVFAPGDATGSYTATITIQVV
jgi:hypothetical protein